MGASDAGDGKGGEGRRGDGTKGRLAMELLNTGREGIEEKEERSRGGNKPKSFGSRPVRTSSEQWTCLGLQVACPCGTHKYLQVSCLLFIHECYRMLKRVYKLAHKYSPVMQKSVSYTH